ncbi:hypothetical protein [Streptomyces sp. NPDC026673]|uniref:hypothetical protein n=1 Tax=Streptomyces sp. NPDC026673 TaxID=3155724 RepID=UPI0033E06D82
MITRIHADGAALDRLRAAYAWRAGRERRLYGRDFPERSGKEFRQLDGGAEQAEDEKEGPYRPQDAW